MRRIVSRRSILTMHSRSRHRRWIALAVILCLLFQQVAMAAYTCTLPSMPPDPAEMTDECSQMGMKMVQEAPALCAEHCSPDRAVAPDSGFAHVPPLALPPIKFEPRLALAPTHHALAGQVPVDRSDPPPRLRYCSLLI